VGPRLPDGPARSDVGEERFRLGLGLDAELSSQHAGARDVLATRPVETPLSDVETHEHLVRVLLQRVDSEQTSCAVNGLRQQAGLPLMRQELAVDVERQLAEPVALVPQPVFEGLVAGGDAGQEIPR
jgi:hypothetical protein